MPMKMGIHCKPTWHDHCAFLDSRLRGNDGVQGNARKLECRMDSRASGNDGASGNTRKLERWLTDKSYGVGWR